MNTFDLINHAFESLEARRDPPNLRRYPSVPAADEQAANCDCCEEQPGVRMIVFAGTDTWICDACADYNILPRSTCNAWADRDADDAGVPMYGEL